MARPKSAAFDDIRASILDAAAGLFAAQGFRNTSIVDIGRACGASKSRMYHYFASKEAMLDEMLVQHVAALLRAARPIVTGPGEPQRRLHDYVLLHLRCYHAARERHTVLIEDADHLSAPARTAIRRDEQALVALLAGLLREVNPARFADRQLAAAHAMLIYGMLNWTSTWYRPSGRLGLAALADAATRLCLHGIADDARSAPPAPRGREAARPGHAARRRPHGDRPRGSGA